MIGDRKNVFKVDKVLIILYVLLVGFGWGNIFSSSLSGNIDSIFNLNELYGKQIIFILLSSVLILITLSIEAKFYERFASIFYFISIISLIGLFIFGKTVNGSTSWYGLGSFTIQPSEFAKAATALALAKYVSDIQTDLKSFKDQIKSLIIVFLPALIIIPQPDPGSALVYVALIFPLYREGLHFIYLLLSFIIAALFVATLAFGTFWVSLGILIIIAIIYFKNYKVIFFSTVIIILYFFIDFLISDEFISVSFII